MDKENRDNILRLSTICALNSLYIKGCKKDILDENIKHLKRQYKYDSLTITNRKVVDKHIEKAIGGLKSKVNNTIDTLDTIDTSMRRTVSDELVDYLVDKLAAKLDEELKSLDFIKLLNKKF